MVHAGLGIEGVYTFQVTTYKQKLPVFSNAAGAGEDFAIKCPGSGIDHVQMPGGVPRGEWSG